MTTENQGYIIDVIADLQKRLASEASSNEYLRSSNKELVEQINSLNEVSRQSYINTENLNAKIADLEANKIETGHLLEYLNHQIAEQKETIETLQSTVKSMDMEYNRLVEKYNAL
jgi:uncharacterized coiled-coil protein SlyX